MCVCVCVRKIMCVCVCIYKNVCMFLVERERVCVWEYVMRVCVSVLECARVWM